MNPLFLKQVTTPPFYHRENLAIFATKILCLIELHVLKDRM